MSMRGGGRSSGGGGGIILDEDDNYGTMPQDEILSDDDNAAPEMQSEVEEAGEKEDPLLLAIDDLEGRVVSALDDVKLHPGIRTSSALGSPTVYEELSILLRPVLEVAAHTGPSVARTYYHGVGIEGVEASCEDVYQRVVSDLVLPVVLEMAQSEMIAAKRGAALEFFKHLYQECQKAGSWLDATTTGPQMGPYGSGSTSSHHHASNMNNPAVRAQQKRRFGKKLAREGEILRYWIQASIACTIRGVFTSEASEMAVASRGIIAASSSLRPCLKHIAQRIKDADDRGASKLFTPVMKMVEGVLKKLFLSSPEETAGAGDSVRASSLKFLEILTLVCSRKPQDPAQKRRGHVTSDFSLEDLPSGHPTITRESLESIAEYAFAILRGLTILGGQVKIDGNLLSDMLLTGAAGGSPAGQVVSILKPAALAYLEIESTLPAMDDDDAAASLDVTLDRSNLEYDFLLSQKPYALTLNAMSAIALNRPVFFKELALCLARRAAHPPVYGESSVLSQAAVLALTAHLRASCLTLLRNALSVSTNASGVLHEALKKSDMEVQADKALSMAKQANALKTAGRAARNRANMFYEWDASEVDKRSSKRQRETDDALAKMRAAKKARGLGHGIQLPQNMADAVELVIANLGHLPTKRPAGASSKSRKTAINLDFVVDAIMTNGASLAQEEGRWYDRDGGNTWSVQLEGGQKFELSSKFLGTIAKPDRVTKKAVSDSKTRAPRALFQEQVEAAASDAVGRIVIRSTSSRSKYNAEFGNEIAARLAWTLKKIKPPAALAASHAMSIESVSCATKKINTAEEKASLEAFAQEYPLVNTLLALDSTAKPESPSSAGQNIPSGAESKRALSDHILYEAYAQSAIGEAPARQGAGKFEQCVSIFVGSVVRAGELTDDKPSDVDRKRVAANAASSLHDILETLPQLFPSSLQVASALCDVGDITKKASEAARKSAHQTQTIAASAALHAAKVAAEKRATTMLLTLRDIAFSRTDPIARRGAVDCAVMIASGSLPASASIEDKALKLVMNVLYPKSDSLSTCVVHAASSELMKAASIAAEKYDEIASANKENESKADKVASSESASSDLERDIMEKFMKKPALLLMALCVRRPELIKTLFEVSCRDKADVLNKTVRANMSKMARAAAAKSGTAAIALKVAGMASDNEASLVLAFLDNLAPASDKNGPGQDFIDACHEIQTSKTGEDGKKDPRYTIPVVSALKRIELVEKLPEFVAAEDKIFLAALERMGDRVARQALLYRDEPDAENPSLKGMTLCEQLVFLHNLDFAAAGLPQKRYLDAIRLCLDNDEIYSDRVVMSALDHMSGVFLTGEQGLPLAYMRTIILVCSKHESLHSWITSVLLPRLVEGKIYTDRRQWEGWMRCAKMLENTGEGGVSSLEAIRKLPEEQFELYRTRYGEPGQE